uniref:Uncharacterized protein LOC105647985 isoform X1 n=1 Tax=Rhizophora mucronata TaxID=61149 RepID=A0A2P2N0D0_RHIMU
MFQSCITSIDETSVITSIRAFHLDHQIRTLTFKNLSALFNLVNFSMICIPNWLFNSSFLSRRFLYTFTCIMESHMIVNIGMSTKLGGERYHAFSYHELCIVVIGNIPLLFH